VFSTDQKGTIAEYGIAWAAIKLGIDVYKPLNDGTRGDLIFDLHGKLTRVQCEWAARHGDVLIVRCYRYRRTRNGLLRRMYTADEVDAFAAYSVDTDKC
jgi:PD-(D/E)XK endonuclease